MVFPMIKVDRSVWLIGEYGCFDKYGRLNGFYRVYGWMIYGWLVL